MNKIILLIFISFPLFGQELPDEVFLKTPTQTRNNFNEFILKDGIIWQKPLETPKSYWKKIPMEDGPKNPISIAVGGGYFQALNKDGTVYTLKSAFKTNPKKYKWSTAWGHPLGLGPGANLPLDMLAWDFSQLSLKEDKFVLNPLSRKKDFYLGNAHIFWLHKNGRWIKFMDPWVVSDHSYEVCGPFRGRFKAIKLSAAGSLILIMNKYGEMFTRLYDFDLSGHNSVYYAYAYDQKKQKKRMAPRALPLPGWKRQPKIKGYITDTITVFKSGEGATDRELRVEGKNEEGTTGYWYKDVAAKNWKFRVKEHKLFGKEIKNLPYDSSMFGLAPSSSKRYQTDKNQDLQLTLLDYHPYCSPSHLLVQSGDESFVFILHARGTFRIKPRPRGLTDNILDQNGAIQIPDSIFNNLDNQPKGLREFIRKYLKDKQWTKIKLEAKKDSVVVRKKRTFVWKFNAL